MRRAERLARRPPTVLCLSAFRFRSAILTHASAADRKMSAAAFIGVLGVVYGDIGTSPLYAFRAAMLHFSDDGIERWEILGLPSLTVWSLILTVTVKYVT